MADRDVAELAESGAVHSNARTARATPSFDAKVPHGGYAWWYVDALSDDGAHGITLIAFIGSVFSPYYAWTRRREMSDPANHVSLNVALYGRVKRWAMTERGRSGLRQAPASLDIGPSDLAWDGTALTVGIREITAPWPQRLAGRLRLTPTVRNDRVFTLDAAGRHRWQPIAPSARVEVELDRPELRWSGTGYFDTNDGDRPLEADFSEWDWCRAPIETGAAVLYNAIRRDGTSQSLALKFAAGREVEEVAPLPLAPLPPTLWRKRRGTRADPGTTPRIVQRLEDAPFYSRSVLETQLWGERVTAVHESLSMDRFTAPWVQFMLPFRIPRALW